MRQNGNDDPIIQALKKYGMEVNRQNYLAFAYLTECKKNLVPS